MARAMIWTTLVLSLGCGSKSPLTVDDEPPTDAGLDSMPADTSVDTGIDTGVFECPVGEDCDCLSGGSVEWPGVLVCPSFAGLQGCTGSFDFGVWGDPGLLTASCAGSYRFCASVRARDDSCEVIEVCSSVRVPRPLATVRFVVSTFNVTIDDDCVSRTMTRVGGEVCTRINWTTDDGSTGGRELGCFVPFGPYCFRDCGGGGPPTAPRPPDPEDGEWEF